MELGFVSYTEDVVDLMDSHNVHFYADDTQFLDCCRSTDTASLRARLSNCASDIDLWCRSRLQLNASKTEAIWFGSKPNLGKISSTDCSIQVGASTIQPSAIVRDLGFHLDSELSMKQHVAKVAAANFDHTPLATDSSSRRRGHHPASSPSSCSSHILAWLLQLSASRASTLYNRTAPQRSERRCSTDIRTQSVRAHHTKPIPVTLARHTLARPV